MCWLMNSRAPISAFERPSRASRAIWISWAVNCSRVSTGACGRARRWPAAHARRARRRPRRPCREQLERGAQLVAGVEAARLAPQPFAIEQVGPRELHAHAGAAQPLDRFVVEAIGGVAVAEQRARARLDAERPVASAGLGAEREPLERPFRDAAALRRGRPPPQARRPRWACSARSRARRRRPRAPRRTPPRSDPDRCTGPRRLARRTPAQSPPRAPLHPWSSPRPATTAPAPARAAPRPKSRRRDERGCRSPRWSHGAPRAATPPSTTRHRAHGRS